MVEFSFLFEERFWSVHDIWFLETTNLFLVTLFVVLALILARFNSRIPPLKGKSTNAVGLVIAGILVCMAVFIYWYFPIFLDDYGNAFQYRTYAKVVAQSIPENLIPELLSLQIEPSVGRKTVLNLYGLISYEYQLSYEVIFRWGGLVSGVVYAVAISILVLRTMASNLMRFCALVLSLTAPVTMVFHSHFEIYAPVYAAVAVWMVLFHQYLHKSGVVWFFIVAIWSLICYKLHPLCAVLIFGSILAGVLALGRLAGRLNWKNLFFFVHLPLVAIGLIVYFFIAKDYNDPRFLDGVTDAERLFLPLITPPAPLHKYNLLSINHILDFLNAILLWSIPALVLLLNALLSKHKAINWNDPLILIPLNLTIMLAGILFAINPLLSMPMDRDLFMFPSIFLMVAVFGLLKQLKERDFAALVPVIFIFTVLQTPRILVDSNPISLSMKLEATGKHVFKTYHLHSSRILINALNLRGNAQDYLLGKDRILKELRPFAIVGNDPKYANLLMDDGYYYLRYGNNPKLAAAKLEEALIYDPHSEEVIALLAEANHILNR